jgi:hypothetical protein
MAVVTTFVRAEDLATVLALVSRVEHKTATEIEAMLNLAAALDPPLPITAPNVDEHLGAQPADSVRCPTCGAAPGQPCTMVAGREVEQAAWFNRHEARWRAADRRRS